MSIAARNVARITLHFALCIGINESKTNKSTSKYMKMWDGVDTLFIDKVLD